MNLSRLIWGEGPTAEEAARDERLQEAEAEEEKARVRELRVQHFEREAQPGSPRPEEQEQKQVHEEQREKRAEKENKSEETVDAPPMSPAAAAVVEETPERRPQSWKSRCVLRSLHITLKEGAEGGTFLPSLSRDLDKDDLENGLSIDHLDAALVERLSLPLQGLSGFSFLVGCYERTVHELNRARADLDSGGGSVSQPPASERVEFLSTLLDRLCSFTALFLDDPEMFQQPRDPQHEQLLHMLGADPLMGRPLPADFLRRLTEVMEEDALKAVFGAVLARLVNEASLAAGMPSAQQQQQQHPGKPSATELLRPTRAVAQLCRNKKLAQLVVDDGMWSAQNRSAFRFLPQCLFGRQLENFSFLGPFLAAWPSSEDSRFQGELLQQPRSQREYMQEQVRSEVVALHELQAATFAGLVRGGRSAQQRTLEYVGVALRLNHDRHKMNFYEAALSSHGFINNLSLAMLSLCGPIVVAGAEKFRLLDPYYCIRSAPPAHIEFQGLTRVSASASELAAISQQHQQQQSAHFVTECVYLTLEALHIGVMQSIARFTEQSRRVGEVHSLLTQLEQGARSADGSASSAEGHPLIVRHRQLLTHLVRLSLAESAVLTDRQLLRHLAAFYDWLCGWLVHLAKEGTSSIPPQLRVQPQYIVEDVVEFFLFVYRFCSEAVPSVSAGSTSDWQNLLRFILTFMSGPLKLSNPHLRGRFPEVLMLLLPPLDRNSEFAPGNDYLLARAPRELRVRLVPSLLELYVDIEFGGGSHAFYEKFSTRHIISLVLRFLWTVPEQHDVFLEETQRSEKFLRFANILCNDVIYLLDESLKKLSEIRQEQLEMGDAARWQALPEDERVRRERGFAFTERQTRSLVELANSTVHMLCYMTDERRGGTIAPFVVPEFVERMAHMVDFFIAKLVGPQVAELKVQNREKYRFQPRHLLSEIISIFLHLSASEAFLRCVVADQRSYSQKLFSKAAHIVRHRSLLPERDCAAFEATLRRLETLEKEQKKEEEDLSDVPSEFLDPLLSTIMTDPVVLPHSKQRIDRAVISRHLLNDPCDPFTRQPLTIDMVEPDLELKARIEEFLRDRRGKH